MTVLFTVPSDVVFVAASEYVDCCITCRTSPFDKQTVSDIKKLGGRYDFVCGSERA